MLSILRELEDGGGEGGGVQLATYFGKYLYRSIVNDLIFTLELRFILIP